MLSLLFFYKAQPGSVRRSGLLSGRMISAMAAALVLIAALSFKAEAAPQSTVNCADGVQSSGALYRICVPSQWNGDLVVYAHGYVAAPLPLSIPDGQLSGISLMQTYTQMGYAYATTSYSKNGLAIKEGVADIADVTRIFINTYRKPKYTYLVGISLGAAVAALSIEKNPQLFNGALPISGPIGNFRSQVTYFGDFRLVFDYFFPGVIPGDPFNIPPAVIANFNTVYVPAIVAAITINPAATIQLLKVTRAPIDPADPTSIPTTIIGALFFNVLGSNDTNAELGGNPFDNRSKNYTGSDDDARLNQSIPRYTADQAALNEIKQFYQTSGKLPAPVVTIHTTADPIVPFTQEASYLLKVVVQGSLNRLIQIPILRYGHVTETNDEMLTAFSILVNRVSSQKLRVKHKLGQDNDDDDDR
ncbi:MAG TPA: hypothetical protein VJ302_20695 [Blastocatellia bacterium]|nr:hypothetical protein [Blastocatellia bacterium]